MIKRLRKPLIVFLVIVILISLIHLFFFRTTVVNNLSDYESRRTQWFVISEMLPELSELPEYADIDYQYRERRYAYIFTSLTIRLVVSYDEETYKQEKAKLEELDFLENKIDNLVPEHEFFINSYHFRILNNDSFDVGDIRPIGLGNYPKTISFIATSDEKNSIAYLYFYNQDVDFIRRPMEEIIKGEFRYNW
ncbi:MAG: hypothetical protein FWD34_05060 [Oscillospiraceae bacterium]|nr:hypothetical protein [Oscillospiraceae bacterium]